MKSFFFAKIMWEAIENWVTILIERGWGGFVFGKTSLSFGIKVNQWGFDVHLLPFQVKMGFNFSLIPFLMDISSQNWLKNFKNPLLLDFNGFFYVFSEFFLEDSEKILKFRPKSSFKSLQQPSSQIWHPSETIFHKKYSRSPKGKGNLNGKSQDTRKQKYFSRKSTRLEEGTIYRLLDSQLCLIYVEKHKRFESIEIYSGSIQVDPIRIHVNVK